MKILLCTALFIVVVLTACAWIGSRAANISSELREAVEVLPTLKSQISSNDADAAAVTVQTLVDHTASAREAANDPLWKLSALLPGIGANTRAITELATSADDVARLGAAPLVEAFQQLSWETLSPSAEGIDLTPLKRASPKVHAAAHAVRESSNRLQDLKTEHLLPQVSDPISQAREELAALTDQLNSASDAARIAPNMMGSDGPRRYLLLVQNNAESRATGGIPGAVAVLSFDKGRMSLDAQTSAGALGTFLPPVAVDAETRAIFSTRVGKFMQDVNLTPDYPTTASVAHKMWETRTGEKLDGVISLDPVALSFLLKATGPVRIDDPVVQEIGRDLPSELTSKNVVNTLLSDVYASIDDPRLQDVYFAGAAKQIFTALSSGKADPKKLLDAVAEGTRERRILLWSTRNEEENTLSEYRLGGKITGSPISPAQFGVYFNDGTGGKMDFWMKRQLQIIKDCTRDDYREVTLRVTSTNTAPSDAATSLPPYVTGDGRYGVPLGTVQTNVVVYGPSQSTIDTLSKDGVQFPFAAQRHGQRAVGTSTIRLAPGETTTLDFNFGHIVQDTEPELVVTPTTQAVKDVLLAPKLAGCE